MKIVNKQEFYKLPSGTLFSYYKPCIINDLMVKLDTITSGIYNGDPIDFYYKDLISNVNTDNGEYSEILINAQENKVDFDLDFEVASRDGLFEDDALYVVYNSGEIKELANKIAECIGID